MKDVNTKNLPNCKLGDRNMMYNNIIDHNVINYIMILHNIM